MILEVNDTNFEQMVINSDKPVLVDLTAEWCGPCKMLHPVLEEISNEYKDKIKVMSVNVDQCKYLDSKEKRNRERETIEMLRKM